MNFHCDLGHWFKKMLLCEMKNILGYESVISYWHTSLGNFLVVYISSLVYLSALLIAHKITLSHNFSQCVTEH